MKKYNHHITTLTLLGVVCSMLAAGADDLADQSRTAIENFQRKDSTIKPLFDSSAGYAVFPNVGKGGFIVGGAHGDGLVYEKGKVIGKASVSQATVGAQAGGQTFAEIIFFETPAALEEFKAGNFEMRAEVSGVVAAEGAAKGAKYSQGVAVFAMPNKGLMAQAAIGGQKFKFVPTEAVGTPGSSSQTEKGKEPKP